MARLLICVLLLALATGCKTTHKKHGARRHVLSPAGQYVVTAELPHPQKEGSPEITITRPSDPQQVILRLPYARQVEVVWAPDESAVAIIDFAPNQNRVLVFGIPAGKPLLELRKEDTCRWNPQLPCGGAYQSGYFFNLIWLAPDSIQLSVEMHTPAEPGLPPEVRGVVIANFPLSQAP